ncbi:beta-ketoacyl-[acyl-carrier-protein] synthase family protein [Lignipirellula cremea]|uniref:3-oxoacyl-[acyl-carrier-protein] synthase 2 n=1 Tax=Lignipirellula cremea TaxID=2528010 RepID=A0A518DU41_9BACT|nr:beta-ketoacyl-[acyl-carrier-protein] synthase family protein [Lignipirellula cremea]QDU95357.1 3-oxoacyl-[acyl-carrier-protein] synthase 2 [Lignipirellula cremea]
MSILTFYDPVVISGVGLITSVGDNRESVWQAIQAGVSGVRRIRGLADMPDDLLIGAEVDLPDDGSGKLKAVRMMERAADEALRDAQVFPSALDGDRVGCAVAGILGDTSWFNEQHQPGFQTPYADPWHEQFMPNVGCSLIAQRYNFRGPRICHSTACASSLISILSAARSIRGGQCDAALVGGGEAISAIMASGFRKMRALAEDDEPERACRPFDASRKGFVMGEGAGMLFLERASMARARGARIYAEVLGGSVLCEAHHVTGLDLDSAALTRLIGDTLEKSELDPSELGYINAHGTGTEQNDRTEIRGIRRALGSAADDVLVSSTKSMIGHLVTAAGVVELGVTLMAMRDGFAPPTINLHNPDPECDMDCLPLAGRTDRFQTALKLSVAFGGHLAAVALRRWNHPETGFAYPEIRRAA